jgi:capsular polysaccharide biosynthesis protein
MPKDYFPYFSFNAKMEFEKKLYHLKVTLMYNAKMSRKEFEVLSDEFSGSTKVLIHQLMVDRTAFEWVDINNQDNSAFIQELGEIILRNNI